jgi:inner membrane protein
MDIVTQGILGSVTAQSGARQNEIRLATLTGFLAGLAPDMDTLIRSPGNDLLVLEFHRHFTHSLLFIPVGALIVAVVVWLISKKTRSLKTVYWYALLGISLSGLLDALTSYGTSLLWPFSEDKIAWNLLPIVDPVFTLALFIPLLIAMRKRSPIYSRIGLALAAVYITLALVQSQRANDAATNLIAQRNHSVDNLIVKPTMGNIVLWKSIYISGSHVYADAIRLGVTGGYRIYTGENIPLLDLQHDNPFPANSQASRDLIRFSIISDHWLAIHPYRPGLAGDVRYSMLPTSTEPLWGVTLNIDDPASHLEFVTNRHFTASTRKIFLDMVMGRDLDPPP